MNAQEALTAALRKLRVKRLGYSLTNEEATDGLEVMNTMLKGWSTHNLLIPFRTRESLTLTQGVNPHTIGSGGTLNTTIPIDLESAVITVGGEDFPLDIKDEHAYRDVSNKTLQGQPEWLYYERGQSLGRIYFDQVPDAAYTFVLTSLKPLTTLTSLTTNLTLPDEAERAVVLNLAVDLAPEYGKEPPTSLLREAKLALKVLKNKYAATRVNAVSVDNAVRARRGYHINRIEN